MIGNTILEAQLSEGLAQLGVSTTAAGINSLLQYIELLNKWNKTYNLTSIQELQQMVSFHLLDSIAVLPYLGAGRIVDVGTGPGLPGIPLAILQPDQDFTLVDSNGKKTRFLVQAVGELGLGNVRVVNERAENFRPGDLFDAVISRAFASLADMLAATDHLLKKSGRFLAMKGKYPQEEIEQLPVGFQLLKSIPLDIPGLNAERHLLMLGRS